MYVDTRHDWPDPGPRRPQRPKARLTKRQEAVIVWVVAFNLLMLLLAPIGGASLFEAVVALIRG